MHLAELAEEPQFLENQSGPLGRDWDVMLKMDILDDRIPAFRGGPVRWAQLWGLLVCDPQNPPPRNLPVLLAHVNYAGNAEIAQLASARASVAYCPRTHAYFGHQTPHRYRDMLASGVNVCLATDSLASNPDLKILKEAQFLHQRDQLDPYVALEMITRRGAIALGMESHVGSLSPGKFADIIAFPLQPPGKDLFPALVSQAPDPLTLWINGKRLPQS
jgi:cytosine/adenosine deaminase-related metal-dependent hydrolase